MLAARIASMLAVTAMVLAARAGQTLATSPVPWQSWQHVPAVFDVAPRSDGDLVLATGGGLMVADSQGSLTPFASGPGGYAVQAGPESYIAVSPGLHVDSAGCDFARDDIYALKLTAPMGVTHVNAAGQLSRLATLDGVDSLNGIAFDRTGRFGRRLLVSAPAHGHTRVVAIDCRGAITTISDSAPALEGGLAVAPASFGAYGGDLVAPDENSGRVYAIDPDGTVRTLVESGLPRGGDIGVESAGFVPPGFSAGGHAYLADRATPNNPHPGTDSLLRLDATPLISAGVRDGDLLVATEGAGATIAIRCAAACRVVHVADGPPTGHIEGHLVVVATRAAGTPIGLPAESDLGGQRQRILAAAGIGGAAAIAFIVGLIAWRRRRRST